MACTAQVLQVRHDLLGSAIAVVTIDGQPVQVPCAAGLLAGASVALQLRGAPRVLPLSTTNSI